ncbi:Pnap_2097 family protein [Ancylobacter defluvii]|uniref:Uncharacterized protein n=1 Tax=Ancylobacter defluvii TaxID=1282440 RepID=A0A9W6K0N3_9HYPH|nr:Pnap_2097 family protein [Ancylobacter defluvii]MBS7586712.1 hypothetical protein [Ancylobacter defluvii]GLK86013.1 hypothetical protein GCM10017653_40830 [Ancylobacter defluvii]
MSLVAPSHRLVMEPAWETVVRLGMPHLVPQGLSESWLLKQLGDVHWQLLAARIGRPASAVEDWEGNRVYAAFRQLRLEAARLDLAREDDGLVIRSCLWRLTRTQLISQHALEIGGEAAGLVTLVSAFIRREGGSNRRVCRVEVPGLTELPFWGQLQPEVPPLAEAPGPAEAFSFTPCPPEDFNGAGFLYFPAYVAIAERALHATRWKAAADTPVRERTVRFHANLDAGDRIDVATCLLPTATGEARIASALRRASDGVLMAEIVTLRHGEAAGAPLQAV